MLTTNFSNNSFLKNIYETTNNKYGFFKYNCIKKALFLYIDISYKMKLS